MEKQPADKPEKSVKELYMILRGAQFMALNFPKTPETVLEQGMGAFNQLTKKGVAPMVIAENLAIVNKLFYADERIN